MAFFCNNCRNKVDDYQDILFVEDESSRYFCSELCIEEYFSTLVNYFSTLEGEYREKLGVDENFDEGLGKLLEDATVMSRLLYRPDEIWVEVNRVNEKIYHFISSFEAEDAVAFFGVATVLVYDYKPSFVISVFLTRSEELIEYFRLENKLDDINKFITSSDEEESYIPASSDLAITVEGLKSEILAKHLQIRKEDDIPFEKYSDFDSYLKVTLEAPDEIRRYLDVSEDLYCYIKGENSSYGPFYYVVLCLYQRDDESGDDILVPIFSFPTVDGEIYRHFGNGELVFGEVRS